MVIRLEETSVLLGLPQLARAGQVKGSWAEASLAILQGGVCGGVCGGMLMPFLAIPGSRSELPLFLST